MTITIPAVQTIFQSGIYLQKDRIGKTRPFIVISGDSGYCKPIQAMEISSKNNSGNMLPIVLRDQISYININKIYYFKMGQLKGSNIGKCPDEITTMAIDLYLTRLFVPLTKEKEDNINAYKKLINDCGLSNYTSISELEEIHTDAEFEEPIVFEDIEENPEIKNMSKYGFITKDASLIDESDIRLIIGMKNTEIGNCMIKAIYSISDEDINDISAKFFSNIANLNHPSRISRNEFLTEERVELVKKLYTDRYIRNLANVSIVLNTSSTTASRILRVGSLKELYANEKPRKNKNGKKRHNENKNQLAAV